MTATSSFAARLRLPDTTSPQADRAVRLWLYAVAALIFAMIMLGGATRLTNSGLSMTEWRPVVNLIPPLSEPAWQKAFEKYKQIPQYKLINRDMSLEGYKAIYWWEWTHRALGMLIGASFLLPLVWFWWRGAIARTVLPKLLLIFAAGGVQGLLGWLMVLSGLSVRTDVSQYRLAAHLGAGVLIFGAVLWMAFALTPGRLNAGRGASRSGRSMKTAAWALAGLVYLQILAGGFVAGTDAGLSHNTWPLMDGAFIPNGLWVMQPWHLNLFENVMTVQFNHRMLAYVICVLAVVHAAGVWRQARADAGVNAARVSVSVLALIVAVQAVLGVATLLSHAHIGLALAHQALAVLVFAAALYHADALRLAAPVMPHSPVGAARRGQST